MSQTIVFQGHIVCSDWQQSPGSQVKIFHITCFMFLEIRRCCVLYAFCIQTIALPLTELQRHAGPHPVITATVDSWARIGPLKLSQSASPTKAVVRRDPRAVVHISSTLGRSASEVLQDNLHPSRLLVGGIPSAGNCHIQLTQSDNRLRGNFQVVLCFTNLKLSKSQHPATQNNEDAFKGL